MWACLTGLRFGHWAAKLAHLGYNRRASPHQNTGGALESFPVPPQFLRLASPLSARNSFPPVRDSFSPACDSFSPASDYSPARAIPSLLRVVPHLPSTLPLASLAASDSWRAPPLFIISSSDDECPFPPPSSLLPHPSLCNSFASLLAC